MTDKFDKFKAALEALCREHGVQLSTDGGELITVNDVGRYDEKFWNDPIWQDGIIDETRTA